MRFATCILAFLLLLAGSGELLAGGETPVPTQRDWLVNLVDGMGWSFGLPDQPQDADYLRIMGGERLLRVEAEASKLPTDAVSVKEYTTFGAFSGEGWVSGIATPTTAHLRFLLPWSGTYQLSTSLRLPGHRIAIDGLTFTADGQEQFTRVALGEVELAAGEHEAVIALPANGAIDYLELQAPPLAPIRPLAGWQAEQPLSLDDMAVTTARVLGLEALLPPAGEVTLVEAESAGDQEGAEITDIRHLGEPSGGGWVRAGASGAVLRLSFAPASSAAYHLSLRGAAGQPVPGVINDRDHFTAHFPPYLQDSAIGTFFLETGENAITLQLPPRAGIDSLSLERRRSEGADYRRLIGLPAGTPAPPTEADIDLLLSLLAAIGASR